MTSWRLPTGEVVDDDGLYNHLIRVVDDNYAVGYMDEAFPEIDVCGHPYPAGKVAHATWDGVMWTALKDDIVDGIYVDRHYGSLEEFGIEPVDDDCDSSEDRPEAVIAEGGQD